jgi:hypothetical protein
VLWLIGVLSVLNAKLGCGGITMNEQEKLARYFYEWHNHKNAVTRASYRNMALSLYFELYIF